MQTRDISFSVSRKLVCLQELHNSRACRSYFSSTVSSIKSGQRGKSLFSPFPSHLLHGDGHSLQGASLGVWKDLIPHLAVEMLSLLLSILLLTAGWVWSRRLLLSLPALHFDCKFRTSSGVRNANLFNLGSRGDDHCVWCRVRDGNLPLTSLLLLLCSSDEVSPHQGWIKGSLHCPLHKLRCCRDNVFLPTHEDSVAFRSLTGCGKLPASSTVLVSNLGPFSYCLTDRRVRKHCTFQAIVAQVASLTCRMFHLVFRSRTSMCTGMLIHCCFSFSLLQASSLFKTVSPRNLAAPIKSCLRWPQHHGHAQWRSFCKEEFHTWLLPPATTLQCRCRMAVLRWYVPIIFV